MHVRFLGNWMWCDLMDHRDLDSVVAHASWMISSNSAGTLLSVEKFGSLIILYFRLCVCDRSRLNYLSTSSPFSDAYNQQKLTSCSRSGAVCHPRGHIVTATHCLYNTERSICTIQILQGGIYSLVSQGCCRDNSYEKHPHHQYALPFSSWKGYDDLDAWWLILVLEHNEPAHENELCVWHPRIIIL